MTIEIGNDKELSKGAVYLNIPVSIQNIPTGSYKVKVTIGEISDEFNLTVKS